MTNNTSSGSQVKNTEFKGSKKEPFTLTSSALWKTPDITGNEKAILGFLESNLNTFNPCMSEIMSHTGLSMSTARKCIKSLIDKNVLIRDGEYIGQTTPSVYSISNPIKWKVRFTQACHDLYMSFGVNLPQEPIPCQDRSSKNNSTCQNRSSKNNSTPPSKNYSTPLVKITPLIRNKDKENKITNTKAPVAVSESNSPLTSKRDLASEMRKFGDDMVDNHDKPQVFDKLPVIGEKEDLERQKQMPKGLRLKISTDIKDRFRDGLKRIFKPSFDGSYREFLVGIYGYAEMTSNPDDYLAHCHDHLVLVSEHWNTKLEYAKIYLEKEELNKKVLEKMV